MKRTVWLWQLFGFAAVSLSGTLLHFLYDWTESIFVATFSGVNESTWEHMKLLFWPMLIFAAIQSIFFRERRDFWCIKLRGTLLGLFCIPLLFYLYNGIIGKSPDWVNITIFFIATAAAYIYENRLLLSEASICNSPRVSISVMLVIAFLFVLFTFVTPRINIFIDPLTGKYGI